MKQSRVRDLTAAQEKQFDRQTEKHFSRQREIPPGRDYRWNTIRFEDYGVEGDRPKDKYKANFDSIFPNAPGAGI